MCGRDEIHDPKRWDFPTAAQRADAGQGQFIVFDPILVSRN